VVGKSFSSAWGSVPPSIRPLFELAAESLLIVVFLKLYNLTRNQFGSSQEGSMEVALNHAKDVLAVEKALGFFWEEKIQGAFLDYHGWIKLWNIFYGTMHNVVTISTILYLFFMKPVAYQRCRTDFVIMNLLAIIGFVAYPLMPPRLVPACDEYGGCLHTEYTFVDTMEVYGGIWSWKDKGVASLSNHYAAMPSMHTGYATWCAVSIFSNAPYKWLQALALLHPVFTVYCIVVTANHYLLDAVAGAACFVGAHGAAAYAPKYGRGASWVHVTWPRVRSPLGGGALYARVHTGEVEEKYEVGDKKGTSDGEEGMP